MQTNRIKLQLPESIKPIYLFVSTYHWLDNRFQPKPSQEFSH